MTNAPHKGRPRRPIFDRFWEKVDTSGGPDACWPWLAKKHNTGYGIFRIERGSANVAAHRMAYLSAKGPCAPGLHLDHLCHTNDPTCFLGDLCPHRACCNPAHLEPVTVLMNTRRGRRRGISTDPKDGGRVPFAICLDREVLIRIEKYAAYKSLSRTEAARRVLEKAFSEDAVAKALTA